MTEFLKKQITLLWKFLGFFQPKPIQIVHAAITIFILSNILTGFIIQKTDVPNAITFWAWFIAWIHISFGFIISILGIILITTSIYHKGLKNFFPYLWGEYNNLLKDINASLKFKLIPPKDGGLAAVIQGLGLGALFLTILTGILFFILWRNDLLLMNTFKELHSISATLLTIYLVGHGSMAIFHFINWQKKVLYKNNDNKKQ